MAVGAYNRGKAKIADGTIDWVSAGVVKVLLLDDDQSYVFDADHNVVDDLTPGTNECSGTGYARKTLSGRTATQDDTNDRSNNDATDMTVYSGADFGNVQAAVVYWEVTDDSDSILICYLDGSSGWPIATSGSDLTIQFSATGGVWVLA
jgi:hypothetical protein